MTNLPEEILLQIFVGLPAKSVSRFRCVSKSLNTIIASRDFNNLLLANIKTNPSIIFASRKSKTIYSIDYNSISSLFPSSTSSTVCKFDEFTNRMDYPIIPLHYGNHVEDFLCSCDGWLCILCSYDLYHSTKAIYLWNPLTKKYSERKLINKSILSRCVYGLGYDYTIGNYKLVSISCEDWRSTSIPSEVAVCMFGGSKTWRVIQSIPYYFASSRKNDGLLLNGEIHWLMHPIGEQNSSLVIVSVDIVNEICREVALPKEPIPHPKELRNHDKFQIDVGALGGCLCLTYYVFNVRFDVWVMQDYGVKESWTKSFTITDKMIIRKPDLKLIWSFKNNEILLRFDWGFILYDPKSKRYRRLISNEFQIENIVAENYVPLK